MPVGYQPAGGGEFGPLVERVHGVDFSGAADAGRHIWIASGTIDGDALRIEECRRAESLPGAGRRRDQSLAALRAFIAGERGAAIGLDFPFSLPLSLVGAGTWEAFTRAFVARYAHPDAFKRACLALAGGRELRRLTDVEARTPFSPYNLRLYRQTYSGIRDLLAPLAQVGAACVVPMQPPRPGLPWLLEVCPASTLKRAGLYRSYKGRSGEHRAARERILAGIESPGTVAIPAPLRQVMLDDTGGDALDSLIAAVATARAVRDPHFPGPRDSRYTLEGRVYT